MAPIFHPASTSKGIGLGVKVEGLGPDGVSNFSGSRLGMLGFPQKGGTILRVPIIRIIRVYVWAPDS